MKMRFKILASGQQEELSRVEVRILGFWIPWHRLDLSKVQLEYDLSMTLKKFLELGKRLEEVESRYKMDKDACDQLTANRLYKVSQEFEGTPVLSFKKLRVPPPIDSKLVKKAKNLAKWQNDPVRAARLEAHTDWSKAKSEGKLVSVAMYPGDLEGVTAKLPADIDFLISSKDVREKIVEPSEREDRRKKKPPTGYRES